MACNNTCKICPKAIYSNSVTIAAIAGTETLVIDIPAGYYPNGGQYCLFIIQSIPTTATINMPVAISIGGVTTTVYPLVRRLQLAESELVTVIRFAFPQTLRAVYSK